MTNDKLYLRAGETADGPFTLNITPERAGWTYSGLKVLELAPGQQHTWTTDDDELIILPLSGQATVTCEGEAFDLAGRKSVFDRVTDFCYAPRDATVTVASDEGGVFALPSARCTRKLTPRYGAADEVPVELRGAGQASRQVNNFCSPEAFECDRLIAVEVLTPGGNWSSYPPHKHDQQGPEETELEEIYYFETEGLAYQRVYGTAERPIDVLAEVGTGDVVLIPHGWHGPSIAAPGYDLYYLNVMAGPVRKWLFCDDPAHAWIRGTWRDQAVDPRLPITDGKDLPCVSPWLRPWSASWPASTPSATACASACSKAVSASSVTATWPAWPRPSWRRTGPGPRICGTTWPATSRPWSTQASDSPGCGTGSRPSPAPPRSALAPPTW
jgi:5-deoxy-glucuronate isomerase